MTEQLTSPSNYSINENPLRFNSSSNCMISPSQSNLSFNLKNNLIQFEQYLCQQKQNQNINNNHLKQQLVLNIPIGKKKLTIQIDQSYASPQPAQQNFKNEKVDKNQKNRSKLIQTFQKQPTYSFQQQQNKHSNFTSLISPIENKNTVKYYQLLQEMKILQNKYQKSQQIIQQLNAECQQKDQKYNKLQQKIIIMQSQFNFKNTQLEQKNHRIQYLQQKIKQKQQQIQKIKHQSVQKQLKVSEIKISSIYIEQIQQKLKDKDAKLKQLAKINQKLKNLNKDLIREVKISEKKVRDLQKQLQNNMCLATQQNIHRLKQSSSKYKQKQNVQRCNGTHSQGHNHNKQERQSLYNNLNTTKQKQMSFGPMTSSNMNPAGRKSLDRKKNGQNAFGNTTSAGQLSQGKKSGKIGPSSSANILHKKLLHK